MPVLKQIKLDEISASPVFKTSFHRDVRPLKTSIQNFGILHPVILWQTKDGLKVLDGLARLDIAQDVSLNEISCLVYDEAELDDKNAFLLNLELNRLAREFNLVERALYLQQAHDIYGGLQIPRLFWDLVGIKQNIKQIHRYKDFLRLPELIQKFAVNNNIALPIILGFMKFPRTETEMIARCLFVLPLNQNKLGEILGLLIDIAKREAKSAKEILDETLSQIENDFNAVHKEQSLRRLLHKRRNPSYESHLKDFEDKVAELSLPEFVSIDPAPFFEDDYIELRAKLKKTDDLNALKDLFEDKAWSNLITSS